MAVCPIYTFDLGFVLSHFLSYYSWLFNASCNAMLMFGWRHNRKPWCLVVQLQLVSVPKLTLFSLEVGSKLNFRPSRLAVPLDSTL